ncbi:hypothetical protein MASR2M78_33780 [Treponema sp.]
MAKLPEIVSAAWAERQDAIVFTTIDKKGLPNSIYATCASKYSEEILLVANNFFSKTMENIKTGSKGVLLFITKDKKSYQVKGSLEYHTEGELYTDMKKWNPAKLPGHGVVALKVEEAYSGGEKLL